MKTGGELHQRLIRNARRLSAPEYRAPQIFAEGREWPGDWQGRTMLALCSLYRGLNEGDPERKAVFGQLREILEALPQHCNRDGYFGEPFDGWVVNEQQVSGNSWFLRGLCEAYRLIGDEKILENFNALMDAIVRAKPAAAKGQYVKSVTLTSTMGPGVKVNFNKG